MTGPTEYGIGLRIGSFLVTAGAVAFTLAVVGSFLGLAAPALWVVVGIGVAGAAFVVFRGPAPRKSDTDTDSQGGRSHE